MAGAQLEVPAVRTTSTLDDDVLALARQRARYECLTLSEAFSRYVRDGFRTVTAQASSCVAMRSKYSVLSAQGDLITSEQVQHSACK